jgi:hypothetical protein
MTNLFKKLAAFALLITLSGTQITHTGSERHGLIENTFGFASDTVEGAGRVAGGAAKGTRKVVEGTGDTLTGNRRQRRRQSRNQSSAKAKNLKQRNQDLE